MEERFTIGLLVANQFGVLNRVAGLYGKRGYNIDSLAVGTTEKPHYSRMTIVSTGDKDMQDQVVKQLEKLHDVKQVVLYRPDASVSVEHLLIKLSVDNDNRATISELINTYSGKVRDFGGDFITAELTGETDKLNEFIELSKPYGILELCRSGAIAMAYGTESMLSVKHLK